MTLWQMSFCFCFGTGKGGVSSVSLEPFGLEASSHLLLGTFLAGELDRRPFGDFRAPCGQHCAQPTGKSRSRALSGDRDTAGQLGGLVQAQLPPCRGTLPPLHSWAALGNPLWLFQNLS